MKYLIMLGIIFGLLTLLVIIELILERYYPKNRLSKILNNIEEWIMENILRGA